MSPNGSDEEILVTATIAPLRRWLTIVPGIVAGALLIRYALNTSLPTVWAGGAVVAIGLAMVLGASWMLATTARGIELTETLLRDSMGTVIARVSDMQRLERSTISYKPAHGFVIVMATPAASQWCPGLWWRIGQHIGIGGFLRADEVKVLGDSIRVLIARHGSDRN